MMRYTDLTKTQKYVYNSWVKFGKLNIIIDELGDLSDVDNYREDTCIHILTHVRPNGKIIIRTNNESYIIIVIFY